MKTHYFEQQVADNDDMYLFMAIQQGYVPKNCLLGGKAVMNEVVEGRKPCDGCEGPRMQCGGGKKKSISESYSLI